MNVAIGAVIASIITTLGVNVQGFFIGAEDDPHWSHPHQEEHIVGRGDIVDIEHPGYAAYKRQCASCHRENGAGVTGFSPPLAGSEFAQGVSSIPIRIILHGLQGAIERNGETFNNVMPPFSAILTDENIANILTFVRSSWGNQADAVLPIEVESMREATAGRNSAFKEAELLQPPM